MTHFRIPFNFPILNENHNYHTDRLENSGKQEEKDPDWVPLSYDQILIASVRLTQSGLVAKSIMKISSTTDISLLDAIVVLNTFVIDSIQRPQMKIKNKTSSVFQKNAFGIKLKACEISEIDWIEKNSLVPSISAPFGRFVSPISIRDSHAFMSSQNLRQPWKKLSQISMST